MRILFLVFFFFGITAVSAQEYNKFDINGKRHGEWKKTYKGTNQVRYEGTFDHGKEVGDFKFYKKHSTGGPTAIKMFSKTSDSVKVNYFSVKQKLISKGVMVGKKRVGLWEYYHKGSTKIMMTENYVADKLIGDQLTYYKNGKLAEKTTYKNGLREGKSIMYTEKGIVIKEFTYENDKLHGRTKYFTTNGKIKIEGDYKRGRKDGMWKYYKNGKLFEEKKFPLRPRKREPAKKG